MTFLNSEEIRLKFKYKIFIQKIILLSIFHNWEAIIWDTNVIAILW